MACRLKDRQPLVQSAPNAVLTLLVLQRLRIQSAAVLPKSGKTPVLLKVLADCLTLWRLLACSQQGVGEGFLSPEATAGRAGHHW
jgi:hypothetical protein